MLEAWKLRRKNELGVTYSRAMVLSTLKEWGVENPTQDNIRGHWARHCELVDDAVMYSFEEAMAAAAKEMAQEFAADGPATADSLPDRMIRIYDLFVQGELSQGRIPKVTLDQVRALIDTKTRRRQNERVSDLLDIHVEALTQGLGIYDPAEIVEGEIVREIEEGEVVEGV